ncbi:MAG: hypothetical protein NT071_16090 [Burkholderiales bacterium]|nr:hypothetical protein [Burkholderiales bacterium]
MKRRTLNALLVATAASLAGPALAQQTIKLTAGAGHPPVFLWIKTMRCGAGQHGV